MSYIGPRQCNACDQIERLVADVRGVISAALANHKCPNAVSVRRCSCGHEIRYDRLRCAPTCENHVSRISTAKAKAC